MSPSPRQFSGDTLATATRTARLPLPPDRQELVRERIESMYAVIDALDAVDLGETPPATAFDARWE
jgi:hypothetical protein